MDGLVSMSEEIPKTAVPMINKKELKLCNAYAEIVSSGTAMTMSAPAVAGTQRARSSGSLQIDEGQRKILRVAPSGRITAERNDVGDVPLGFIPISPTIDIDEMLGNRGGGTRVSHHWR